MSNLQNIAIIKSSEHKSISKLASEIYQETFVESAYDKSGKFSHLLARLPQNEFIRLYSPNTTASIFVQGYWLQLCLKNLKKTVLHRESKIELMLEIGINEYGITEVSFFRFEKCVHKVRMKNITVKDLLNSEKGFHSLGRAAVKAFHKVQSNINLQILSLAHLPIVLVLVQQDCIKNDVFDPKRVLLQ